MANFITTSFENLFFFLRYTAIFWGPIGLGIIAWHLWLRYIRMETISAMKWKLLQIRIPKDVYKSPLAMEVFLSTALYQTGGVGTWYHKYWLGNVPAWFSLELVSIEGKIYFFIRTLEKFQKIVESQLYAQYPQAELIEVEDYATKVPPHDKNGDWQMYGVEFALTKEDPYPIKTYIDYGMDKATGSLEEEEKIDPMNPTLEFLGSIGQGEQIWYQILIRPAHWARFPDPDAMFKKITWQKLGEKIIKELKKKQQEPVTDDGAPSRPTRGESDLISALERSITKYGFDCGIRGIYIARKDKFNPNHITPLMGAFKQYNSGNMNGFKIAHTTSFDYPWQDFTGSRATHLKKLIFDAYRLRAYFYYPYPKHPFILNTEELATIFHFPGRVSETPSFKRIESKKSEPPADLPQ